MTFGHGYRCRSLTEMYFDESLHPDCLSCCALSLLSGFLINNICTLHFFTISTHGVRFAAEVPRYRAPTGGPSRRAVPVAGACPPAICQSGWGPGAQTGEVQLDKLYSHCLCKCMTCTIVTFIFFIFVYTWQVIQMSCLCAREKDCLGSCYSNMYSDSSIPNHHSS